MHSFSQVNSIYFGHILATYAKNHHKYVHHIFGPHSKTCASLILVDVVSFLCKCIIAEDSFILIHIALYIFRLYFGNLYAKIILHLRFAQKNNFELLAKLIQF